MGNIVSLQRDGSQLAPRQQASASAAEEEKLLNRLSSNKRVAACLQQQSSLPLLAASRGYEQVLIRLSLLPGDSTSFCEVRDSKLRTPLHLAAKAGQPGAVAILIDPEQLGADIYATDKRGNTALHLAAMGSSDGHAECVGLLLTASRARESQPAQPASGAGRRNSIPCLVNMQNSDGFTALHIAAASGNYDVVQMLLGFKADLWLMTYKQGRSSWPWLNHVPARSTALHLAAAAGHMLISKAIVQAYLDIPRDVRKPDPRLLHDVEGHVPYMVAGNHGHFLCAQLLLLISRDETHAYWQGYMQLGRQELVVGDAVPSLASLAQAAWLAHLEEQLSEMPAPTAAPARHAPALSRVQSSRSGGVPAGALPAPEQQQQQEGRKHSVSGRKPSLAGGEAAAGEQGDGAGGGSCELPSLVTSGTENTPATTTTTATTSQGVLSSPGKQAGRHTSVQLERTPSTYSCSTHSEEATGKGQVCEVCFERTAGVEILLCGHSLCAGCSRRVVRMEAKKPGSAPKCPFCQQFILSFVARDMHALP